MSKAAVASNTDVLESLPPVVPSIGWRKPQRHDEGGIDSNTQTTTTSQPESSQAPAVAATAGEPNNDDAVKPTNIPSTIKIGNRTVITSKPPRQWAWKSFTSSARNDSANFFHWVRANIEYADYPYARFDVHLDPLTYTDEEYEKYLAMSTVEDLGDTLPDFLMVGNQIQKGGDGTEKTKAGNNSTAESSLFQQQLLQSNKILPWTKAETDVLMELCQSCDLRWPVIIDRWHMRFSKGTVSSLRKVEDLQYRYYQIGSILTQKRVVAEVTKLSVASTPAAGADVLPSKDPKNTAADATVAKDSSSQPAASAPQQSLDPSERAALEPTVKLPSAAPSLSIPASGTSNRGKMFDLVAERERRRQLDYTWNQSKEEAQEEAALRAELRAVEAQLRKLKKAGKHLVTSGSALAALPPPQPTKKAVAASVKASTASTKTSAASAVAAAPASARPNTTIVSVPVDPFFQAHQEVDASFNETAPVPTPGTPYLQSGRLFPPNIEGHAKLKKSTLKQMDEILSELGVPKEPIATKRSCDLFDGVRKDAMTLLILQKMALKKETELADKKARLERRTSRATATTTAQEKKEDETSKADDPKGSKPAEKTKESSQTGGAGATAEKSSKKKDSHNGSAGATTEKASKKKRKAPTPAPAKSSASVVAPVPSASQPGSTAAIPAASTADPHKPAAVASSAPSSTAPAPPTTTSSALISQGKTTKAAGRKRVRKK